MNFLMVLLSAQPGKSGGFEFVFLGMMILVFYFFMIRPQVKKQKEASNFRNALKKGDKVTTTGGLYGKINDVKETTVSLEIADNVVVKVDKTAVMADPATQATAAKK